MPHTYYPVVNFPIFADNNTKMEEKELSTQLEDTFVRFQDNLDAVVLPKFKEDLRLIYSAYKTVHSILLKKGFIHEDPYKSETKLSEITLPATTGFTDSEKIDQMSIRLSSYEVQLDFLLNYYQFSMEFLDIPRIRLVAGLLRYISWDQLGPSAQDPVTKALAELITKAKTGADALSVGLMNDSLEQIRKTIPACFKPLKDITDFSRELYKIEMRAKVFSGLSIKSGSPVNKEDLIRQVKKAFPSAMSGKPFYPELAGEVIDEDYGPGGAELKETIVRRFTIEASKPKVVRQAVSFTGMLLDSIRTMASAARYLEDAVRKLVENNTLMQNKKATGFMEKFKQWFSQLSSKPEADASYELEYFDSATSTTKREKIQFESFITDVQKHVRVFNGLTVRGGVMYNRMEKADENTLFSFLEKQTGELSLMYRRLQGLDTFFKNEIPREQKEDLRGIKIELTAIKNSMARATQKKHEYIARKEESEQMKKLGIK
ncbi:MAG: hypothetical protein LBQ57_06610 [Spirochaetales bacterium]|jgi:hypothetical protein|nr:hypothetical protein [Spirochaetales bacterium]